LEAGTLGVESLALQEVRLTTLGGNLLIEKGDLGWSEDALRRLDEDPVPLKLVKECPQVIIVLFE
jgi:hypothetical protein